MTCIKVGDAIICGDFGNTVPQRRYGPCPHCKTRRRILVEHGSPWYPPTIRCCHCGMSWSADEVRRRRPTRAQRAEVPALKARWAAASRTVEWDDHPGRDDQPDRGTDRLVRHALIKWVTS